MQLNLICQIPTRLLKSHKIYRFRAVNSISVRMPEKRPAQDGQGVLAPAKKQRNEMVIVNNSSKQLMAAGPPRSSNMEAPIMLLTGHGGEVYTAKFHPSGNLLASAGFERQIYLWNVYGE